MIPMKAILRPLAMSDLDNIMTWVNDPEVTRNFAKLDHKFTREEEHEYLEKLLADPKSKMYAVETEQGEYVGNVGLQEIYTPFPGKSRPGSL